MGKFFFLLVIIGFFMPMVCDMNAFELVDSNQLSSWGIFAVFATFLSAIVGLVIGVLLLAKKNVSVISDWIVTSVCSLSYVIMFCYAGFEQGYYEHYQSGAFMALVGSVAPLIFQIISAIASGSIQMTSGQKLEITNFLLISAILSSLIILCAIISPIVRAILMSGRFFIGHLFSLPILIGIIGIAFNIIGLFKMKKLFSLIAGGLFGISALIRIITLFTRGFYPHPSFIISIWNIPILLIISAILCFVEFSRSKRE